MLLPTPAAPEDPPRPLAEHLGDLRGCILRAFVGWGAATLLAFALYPRVLTLLIRPPLEKLVYTSPTEPFFAQCKLSMVMGLAASLPWVLFQAWRFLSPGLMPRERAALLQAIPASYALFLAGGALGLFGAAPMGLKFLLSYSGPQLQPYITLSAYLSFLSAMTLGMGLLFQLPLCLWILARLGLVEPRTLAAYRRHVLLGILLAAAAVTPSPDVYGQLLIAAPTYLLFELSLLAMRLPAGKR